MKAILMSIKPRYAQLILGKTKTIEIRKRFPKDFKGRVYIYHTKTKNPNERLIPTAAKRTKENDCSGKVVARFWCDKVEEFGSKYAYAHKDNHFYDILKCACLTPRELTEYAHFTYEEHIKEKSKLYAIHISNLEIFDKPKELSEFETTKQQLVYNNQIQPIFQNISLTKAPQSWQYVEIGE